jgi:DNA-directed RNA polymerase subunit RPC12/RpoP
MHAAVPFTICMVISKRDMMDLSCQVIRGLILDKEKGNLVKADRFGYIKRAMHGTKMLSNRAIRCKLCSSLIFSMKRSTLWQDPDSIDNNFGTGKSLGGMQVEVLFSYSMIVDGRNHLVLRFCNCVQ